MVLNLCTSSYDAIFVLCFARNFLKERVLNFFSRNDFHPEIFYAGGGGGGGGGGGRLFHKM